MACVPPTGSISAAGDHATVASIAQVARRDGDPTSSPYRELGPRVGPRQARSANPQIGPKLHRAERGDGQRGVVRAAFGWRHGRSSRWLRSSARGGRRTLHSGSSGLPALNCTPISTH